MRFEPPVLIIKEDALEDHLLAVLHICDGCSLDDEEDRRSVAREITRAILFLLRDSIATANHITEEDEHAH
jgi:hypothetical protein